MIETAPSLTEQQTPYLSAGTAVETILSSDAFREKRGEGISAERALVFAAKQLSHQETEDTPESRKQADSIAILSQLDEFTHGIEALRHHHHVERLDKKTVEASKLRLVEFNHTIQDMLDHDPTIEFDEIVGYMSDMHGILNHSR